MFSIKVRACGLYLASRYGVPFRVASGLLVVHLLITYLVKGTVVARYIHIKLFPLMVHDKGMKGSAQWLGITLSTMLLSYVLANAIPFFDSLTGLIGSVLIPIICFTIPALCYVKARAAQGRPLPPWEMAIVGAVHVFSALIFFVGTYDNVQVMLDHVSASGGPFGCQCINMWGDVARCCAEPSVNGASDFRGNASLCEAKFSKNATSFIVVPKDDSPVFGSAHH